MRYSATAGRIKVKNIADTGKTNYSAASPCQSSTNLNDNETKANSTDENKEMEHCDLFDRLRGLEVLVLSAAAL